MCGTERSFSQILSRRSVSGARVLSILNENGLVTRPFSFRMDKTLAPDTDLLESICENDRSVPHMLGGTEITRLAPAVLAKYAGSYEYAPGRPAVISFEGDLLFLQEG